MPNPNPVQTEEFKTYNFKPISDEPLSNRVQGIRLPKRIDVLVESLSGYERAAWLRRVITEAAERELMEEAS